MKTETRKTTERLRCLLTKDEKIEVGKALAEATNELEEIQDDKAQVVADFKAKITAIEARIAILSTKLRGGYELRDVECVIHFDKPKVGMKKTVRTDTKEVVSEVQMSEEEKQRSLPLEG